MWVFVTTLLLHFEFCWIFLAVQSARWEREMVDSCRRRCSHRCWRRRRRRSWFNFSAPAFDVRFQPPYTTWLSLSHFLPLALFLSFFLTLASTPVWPVALKCNAGWFSQPFKESSSALSNASTTNERAHCQEKIASRKITAIAGMRRAWLCLFRDDKC